jgi:hypothetical protein
MKRLEYARVATSFTLINAGWESRDRHRTWTRIALFGVPLAGLLAAFGLPSIDIHGPLHYLGVMGPTCGMTRGVMWFTRGNLARAWLFNPASFLVAPAMVVLISRAFYGYLTGRWLTVSVRWRPWLWVVPTLFVLALSVHQQINVGVLLANPAG